MTAIFEFVQHGGSVMFAIIALSVLLYWRCFKLLLVLRRKRELPGGGRAARQLHCAMLQEQFRHQRIALGAMIAAAPLLGLLGTVHGMSKTFENLAGDRGDASMEGLASGISEVLVATESGLAVAIPALLLVYLAHRRVQRQIRELGAAGVQRRAMS